jgi:hypothetical protein
VLDHVPQQGLAALASEKGDAAQPSLGIDLPHGLSTVQKFRLQTQSPQDAPAAIGDEISAIVLRAPARRGAGIGKHDAEALCGETKGEREPDWTAPGDTNVKATCGLRLCHAGDTALSGTEEKGANDKKGGAAE